MMTLEEIREKREKYNGIADARSSEIDKLTALTNELAQEATAEKVKREEAAKEKDQKAYKAANAKIVELEDRLAFNMGRLNFLKSSKALSETEYQAEEAALFDALSIEVVSVSRQIKAEYEKILEICDAAEEKIQALQLMGNTLMMAQWGRDSYLHTYHMHYGTPINRFEIKGQIERLSEDTTLAGPLRAAYQRVAEIEKREA